MKSLADLMQLLQEFPFCKEPIMPEKRVIEKAKQAIAVSRKALSKQAQQTAQNRKKRKGEI